MTSIIIRWIFAFCLIAATFNPTSFNYVSWAQDRYQEEMPLTVLLGLLLFVGYIVYLRATLRSIGGFGMFLVAAIVGAMIWVLIGWGLLSLNNPDFNLWLGILALSLVLGIGLSWSIVRRRLSGQVDMDDVED